MKNNDSKKPVSRPHYYGKIDGVHVFHGTSDDHRSLIGEKIENPSEDSFKSAVTNAKQKKTKTVVIFGAPPESLRSKLSETLGHAVQPGSVSKSEGADQPQSFDQLEKAFLQPDGQTFTDIKAHAATIQAANPDLMKWGSENLSKLKKDAIETFNFHGKNLKVRKHDADLYSGWVEHEGAKLHNFEKVTLPELMVQLQSKLELYGKENQSAEVHPIDSLVEELKSLIAQHFKSHGMEIPEDLLSLPAESDTKKRLDGLVEKVKSKMPQDETPKAELKEIEQQVIASQAKGDKEVIPAQDLASGLINPEDKCEDCGSAAPFCDCYSGLPRPRLEFDGKKVTIFFKSEYWDLESREAFCEDLKRRAGQILKKNHRTS